MSARLDTASRSAARHVPSTRQRLLLKVRPAVESVLGIVLFLGVWSAASGALGNASLLPSPAVVYGALKGLLAGEIYPDIGASLVHLGIGYAIGVFIGLALAIMAARFEALASAIEPVIEILRPISAIAWIPLAILMFGVSAGVPIFLIAYAAAFPIFVNTLDGMRRLDVSLLNAARSLGASANFISVHVILPGALPHVMTGARFSLGVAWMAMVAGELVGADSGLGFRIMWFQEFFAMNKVMAIIIVIGVLGFVADASLRALQRRILRWDRLDP